MEISWQVFVSSDKIRGFRAPCALETVTTESVHVHRGPKLNLPSLAMIAWGGGHDINYQPKLPALS